jgi:hypothetical protein
MLIRVDEAIPEANDPAWMDGFEKEIRRGWELEKANYMARQQLARKEFDGSPLRTIDGLGQMTMVLDARTWFRWQQEDEHFWEDKGNVKRFLRDNPEARAPRPEQKARVVV